MSNNRIIQINKIIQIKKPQNLINFEAFLIKINV